MGERGWGGGGGEGVEGWVVGRVGVRGEVIVVTSLNKVHIIIMGACYQQQLSNMFITLCAYKYSCSRFSIPDDCVHTLDLWLAWQDVD